MVLPAGDGSLLVPLLVVLVPLLVVEEGVWWYYQLEMALYWCLFFTQFTDIKRKVGKSQEKCFIFFLCVCVFVECMT